MKNNVKTRMRVNGIIMLFFLQAALAASLVQAGNPLQKQAGISELQVLSFSPGSNITGLPAQQVAKTVSGKITDQQGEPLPGVTIIIKGTTNGTVTNIDGNYNLTKVPDNATLLFSFVGMKTQEIVVNGRTQINVLMEEETIGLEEVVAIGYGYQKKMDVTGSIQNINNSSFIQGQVNNIGQLIQGKISGMSVASTAPSDPNASVNLQIRGAASRNAGNGPLIVVDNVPGADLSNVSPEDIQSISILKDASSSAIYGTRGANGVIIITTKSAEKSDIVRIEYDGYIATHSLYNKPGILSAEEFVEHGRDIDYGYRTNWYDELVRDSPIEQNHHLSISKGSENSSFRLSLGYRDADGIDIASARKEYSSRLNYDMKALDGLLELNGTFAYRYNNESYTEYDVFSQAVTLNPTYPVYDPDDLSEYTYFSGYDQYNPVDRLKNYDRGAIKNYMNFDITAKVNWLDNLNTSFMYAAQVNNSNELEYDNSHSKKSLDSNYSGYARQAYGRWNDKTFETNTNYHFSAGNHDLKLLAGYSFQNFYYKNFWAENMNFASDAFEYNNLGSGSFLSDGKAGMGSGKTKSTIIAFYGRANYSFQNTWLLTTSIRREGSSKFGSDNKWGWFPAVSGAWRISQMDFMKGTKGWLDDLKLRVGWGIAGREDFDPYISLTSYNSAQSWLVNGEWITTYGPSKNANPDLKWEKAVTYNIGIDFTLLNSQISGALDFYQRESKDMIYDYNAISPPAIYSSITTNVGSTRNRGVELTLSGKLIKKSNFSYNLSFNGSYGKSKLTSLSNGLYSKTEDWLYSLPSPGNPGYAFKLEKGCEIGSFYGWKYAGVSDDNEIMVLDKNGNAILASNRSDEDRCYIGNGTPKFQLSLNNEIKWKNWDLNLFFRSYLDYDIMNLKQMYFGLQQVAGINLLEDAYGRNGEIKSEKLVTDYFLENGNFLKLDMASLGYNFKIQNKYISSARIYLTGKNLFTITGYTGQDPSQVQITGLTPGIEDKGFYPTTRTYSLGVKLIF